MGHAFYTVQHSDEAEGLLGIARRLYGDEARWPALYNSNRTIIGNNPSVVRVGQQLYIPDLLLEAAVGDSTRVYHVQLADVMTGLPGIAQQLWGKPERWRELYAVNRGAIGDDPQALQPGQTLIVP